MVIGFTPVGAYYAGKEFEEAWLDFGASDKKDVKRVTTATLNLMLLGIGTKKAMAEYRASKEILTHADELERSGKVDEAKAYRETAAYKKADATDKLLNLNRQMKDTHQSISNYIQERNDKLTTLSRTTKGKFSADSLKPAQNVIRESDLPAKTKVTVKDPLVIDDLIENSFTNDSFFYEVADKEFYVSDWDIVKVEKPKKFDSMSEQASKEMQDYLRVIKVKTKDTRAGFEDQYIEKDILLIIEDKMLVSKENADAVSSLELPSNLANGAEKLFTYDSVFGNTPDLIVIHMSKDLMNKPEAFSYALSRQMAELTAIKDALIKHEEGLPEAQMKKVIKEAEEPIHFDLADQNFVEQMFEMAKDDPDSEISKQFMRAVTEDGACFPAGTRITTDKGLKRIEDIQVGDMVLSKHESGIGEQEFKPVIRTVVHHNKEIWGLTYCIVKKSVKANSLSDFDILNMSRKGKVSGINATPNHPFWVKGVGWTRLDALEPGQLIEMKDEKYSAYVIFAKPDYQTSQKNVFATLSFDTFLDVGEYLDDENYTHSQENPEYIFIEYDEKGDPRILEDRYSTNPLKSSEYGEIYVSDKTRLGTVYNFEVADNHTYYIFDEMWVHNACPKFTFEDVKPYNKNVPVPKSHSEISKQFMRAVTEDGACFPAGTRITTDKGLKRIEDIQVGDMVLSKHESGIGKQEFKPVVKTIVHHNKPIFELTYAIVKNSTKAYGLSDTSILNLSRKGKVFGVKATPNHPFWVKGQGWTNLEDLKKGQLLEMKEEGYQAYVILSCPEYQTNHADVKASLGFTSVTHLDQFADKNKKSQYTFQVYSENGDCTELLDGRSSYSPVHIEGKGEIYVTDNPRRDTVYNFEVADNHTYYIFDELWVHNDKCPVTTDADVKTWSGSPVPNLPIFHSLKEANDFFKSLPEDSDLLVPAIVRVGRVKVNSVTKGKINAVDFEHGSRNAIYAKIGDEYIQFEYIAFRKHPNYQTVDTNGVVTTNNSVLNFVKFEGFTEEMINGKLVKSYIDRKASLPYQALSTKKVAPAEKGVDGKLEFANAARHYAIDNLYNQLDSLTRTQNADHNLIYALKKQADIDVFNVQILEAIKDNSFELWKVDTDGYRTRMINGKSTKVWEGYKLKEVDSQSAQYKCKLLNINTNLNITGLITKNNKSMVYQNHLLKRVIKKLTFNGYF